MAISLPRVEALLGSNLEAVTYEHVSRLIQGHVVEDADLDFKSEVHRDGADLAADVSAMANTRGGVLVIGLTEDGGAASAATPVPLSDEVTNRMKQWLAQYVVPYVATDIYRVPSGADSTVGFYLVVVARSPHAPHAVWKRESLRFYHRDGGRNRPLSESEVADAYRNRFREAREQVQRLGTVSAEGVAALAPTGTTVWLALCNRPANLGWRE
jgi:predicted HTH transcriptional regulator